MSGSRFAQLAMAIAWPSFLMASVLEALVFALVDPTQLHFLSGAPVDLPANAVYTLAFFIFWAVIAVAGVLTRLLEIAPAELNRDAADTASSPPR